MNKVQSVCSLQAHLLLKAASSLTEEEAVAVINTCALRVGEAACGPLINLFFVRRLHAKVDAFLERVLFWVFQIIHCLICFRIK